MQGKRSILLMISGYRTVVSFTSMSLRVAPTSFRRCQRALWSVGRHQDLRINRCLLFSHDAGPSNSDPVPEKQHTKSYKLSGVGRRSKVEILTNTDHNLTTDVPMKMGGTDAAPQPVETLLAAWMGCTQATSVFVGRQMSPRVVIDSLEFVEIEAFRDERGALSLPIEETPSVPSRLQRIAGTIKVSTRSKEPISDEQLDLLKEQTEIRCPVANMMISSGCTMDVDWVAV